MNFDVKKLVVGAVVFITVGFIPLISVSKDNSLETINLSKKNLLVLNSEVNGDSVGPLIVKGKELDSKFSGFTRNAPIYLYLNTPGGSVQSGLELIEAMKGLGRKVHTISAFSASMGFQIAENLDNRYVLESGVMMSHRTAGEFSGSFGGLSPSELDQRINLFVQITKEMDEQTVSRTNGKQTLESYQKAYSNELWLTGKEAVVQGYADAIVRVRCAEDLYGTTHYSLKYLGTKIEYDLLDCPLNSAPMNVKVDGSTSMTEEYKDKIKELFLSTYEMKSITPMPMRY